MNRIDKAFKFAKKYHGTQTYGDKPYIFHLEKTYSIAYHLNLTNDILIACILHDVIEDTSASYKKIKKEFGAYVADIVYDVTDELGKSRKEIKEKTYKKVFESSEAVLVKLCDRLANIRHSKLNHKPKFDMYAKEFPKLKELVLDYINQRDRMITNEKIKELLSNIENEFKGV